MIDQFTESRNFLGQMVTIAIDRPLGFHHPQHEFIYPLNYGYVPGTRAPDGEELDAYLLGVFEPVERFNGRCLAIIHRLNDDDDKLIIVPDGHIYTNVQIEALTEFQERFFQTIIMRVS